MPIISSDMSSAPHCVTDSNYVLIGLLESVLQITDAVFIFNPLSSLFFCSFYGNAFKFTSCFFFSFAVSHLVLIPCREVFILNILEFQTPDFQYNPHSDFSADPVNLFPLKISSTSLCQVLSRCNGKIIDQIMMLL